MNVGTIGHVDHGKTTLTAAITKGDHAVERAREAGKRCTGRWGRDGRCEHRTIPLLLLWQHLVGDEIAYIFDALAFKRCFIAEHPSENRLVKFKQEVKKNYQESNALLVLSHLTRITALAPAPKSRPLPNASCIMVYELVWGRELTVAFEHYAQNP